MQGPIGTQGKRPSVAGVRIFIGEILSRRRNGFAGAERKDEARPVTDAVPVERVSRIPSGTRDGIDVLMSDDEVAGPRDVVQLAKLREQSVETVVQSAVEAVAQRPCLLLLGVVFVLLLEGPDVAQLDSDRVGIRAPAVLEVHRELTAAVAFDPELVFLPEVVAHSVHVVIRLNQVFLRARAGVHG